VLFFWSSMAGNVISASTEELTSSAAMVPLRSALARGHSPLLSPQSRPIWFQQPRLHTPSGLCNRSTVDHGRGPRRPCRPVHAHRGGPSQPQPTTWPPVGQRRGQPRTAKQFCTLTPLFRVNQPAVQPSSKVFLFNPIFFNLNPALFYNSVRSPELLEKSVLILLNLFLIQFIHRNVIQLVLCITFTF